MSVYIARNKAGALKSPYWQYDWQHRGHRFRGSFDGKDGLPEILVDRPRREAERAEAVLRASSSAQRLNRGRMTLHQAAEHYWLTNGRHQSNSTSVWGFISNLERIIGKSVYIDEIDDAVISDFVARRRTEKARRRETLVANATVNRDTETLGQIFKCVRKIARMPRDLPDFGAHKLPEKQIVRSLGFDEEAKLFAAIDELRPDFRDLIEFALITGKRLSEILFLEKAKVDRRGMTARTIAKGGREVTIALTSAALAIIERNWMYHPTRVFTYEAQRGFTGKAGVRRKGQRYPYTVDGWREAWKAILEKAGITGFRFHDFRHTTATRVLAATGNLKAVQDTLDHADIRSTSRYAHTYTAQRREALEAAESLRRIPEKPADGKTRKENG